MFYEHELKMLDGFRDISVFEFWSNSHVVWVISTLFLEESAFLWSNCPKGKGISEKVQ